MKHIVWAVAAFAFIFTGTAGSARGFSVGIFAANTIDAGIGEYLLYDRSGNAKQDELVVPGAGLFADYTFTGGFSVRTGVEMYELVSGGNIHGGDMYEGSFESETEYSAAAVPVLLGFTASPDKGRTNIYAYTGLVVSRIEIKHDETKYLPSAVGGTYPVYNNSEHDTIVPGFAAVFGMEKRIFYGFYIMLEYAFYKCESIRREESTKYDPFDVDPESTEPITHYESNEFYGLPRQVVRIGLKYSF